jgi:hypothetical protein
MRFYCLPFWYNFKEPYIATRTVALAGAKVTQNGAARWQRHCFCTRTTWLRCHAQKSGARDAVTILNILPPPWLPT